jgi:hypothetical protein
LRKLAPIEAISQELVRFDMQLMANPDIQGKEYQQGTLAGYETREYLITQIQYYATNNQPRTPHTFPPITKLSTVLVGVSWRRFR